MGNFTQLPEDTNYTFNDPDQTAVKPMIMRHFWEELIYESIWSILWLCELMSGELRGTLCVTLHAVNGTIILTPRVSVRHFWVTNPVSSLLIFLRNHLCVCLLACVLKLPQTADSTCQSSGKMLGEVWVGAFSSRWQTNTSSSSDFCTPEGTISML